MSENVYSNSFVSFSTKPPEKLKAAGSLLMKVFGVLAVKGPKRVGALYVTCQLFKTYFKLGTVNLCRSVIRSIETARIFDFEGFRTRDKVTYMYYTGRLEVFNENFPAADTKLSYALQYCNHKKERNIRYDCGLLLDCITLALRIIPTYELLRNYKLHEYINIVQALRKGDLRLLRHVLDEHEDRWLVVYCSFVDSSAIRSRVEMFVLKVRCVSCLGKVGAPGLPETQEENVSSS
ncbi:unnamed protein product [Thlaspi arvense]|uniref:PCI domain-containing protein n=1 Tax=Thlaspi arvense TaxID=13288 RepID=A0AAU9RVT4_THLAR|nr:unnamed protein product [Thlaspi arvense]